MFHTPRKKMLKKGVNEYAKYPHRGEGSEKKQPANL
jgi:hypothetical protein